MQKLLILMLVMLSLQAYAQDDLFNTPKPPSRKGVIFGVKGGINFPGGDMADRFGTS